MNEQETIIVRRAARELKSGMVVNLGIGLPTLIPALLPPELKVILHSENGFVGMGGPVGGGTPDNDVIDAGGRAVSLLPGAACFDSVLSFSLVRGGHLDLAVLGAFEVSMEGDLANWIIPGKSAPGIGGGMELAQKARRVIVLSRHLDKNGNGKLVEKCTLPLTAPRCVDTLITERAVFRKREGRMVLASVHPSFDAKSALEGIACQVEVAAQLEPWEAPAGHYYHDSDRRVKLGDKVRHAAMHGRVVFIADEKVFAAGFEDAWKQYSEGVGVKLDSGELVVFPTVNDQKDLSPQ